jgi:hypothetical protein
MATIACEVVIPTVSGRPRLPWTPNKVPDWETATGADFTRKKQKELLSKALRRFFVIDAEPFTYKKGEGWTAQLVVLNES